MKKITFLSFASALSVCLALFTGCGTLEAATCPYVISNPRVELSDDGDDYNFAGMHFSLLNGSDKILSSFTISFMLYDSEGNNPFVGSNCVVSKCEEEMQPESVGDFVIDLDPYISSVPDEPYALDYVYLREIRYADGSLWKDPYGMYCVREAYE